MPIKRGTFYWLECDKCGAKMDYDDYTPLYDNAGDLLQDAMGMAWLIEGERCLCPDCADAEEGDGA